MHETPANLVAMFCQRVAADGDRPALFTRRGGGFESESWNELARDVRRAAVALRRKLAVQHGDRVIHVSENRREWIVADLAILLARAVHVPVHAPLTGPQIAQQIVDSGARVVIVSGTEQAEKLAAVTDALPPGLVIVSYDSCELPRTEIGAATARFYPPIAQLSMLAADVSDDEALDIQNEALSTIVPDDVATILYTSGTTGEPKGVLLTHRNLTTNACSTLAAFQHDREDIRVGFLPLSHIYARTCDLYMWIAQGMYLALAQSRETVLDDCAAMHPTVLNGVPYFYERVMRTLRDEGRGQTPGSLREKLGGRIRYCCAGGAALPDHVARFYFDHDVPLLQGYGLSESSPVITMSTPTAYKIGTVGRPIPDVEIRIAPDGEILTRGPHVMAGYYHRPGATAEVLKDGWLYTGDLGSVDADGFLKITGRKKEILVTAGGKNIAPVLLESLLAEDPLIHQAMIVGDGRSYLTALIVPNGDALGKEIAARGIAVATAAEALVHPQVLELYHRAIQQRLATVSRFEQVRRFTLLDQPFTIESGELTPTLKIRRDAVALNHADRIRGMYDA